MVWSHRADLGGVGIARAPCTGHVTVRQTRYMYTVQYSIYRCTSALSRAALHACRMFLVCTLLNTPYRKTYSIFGVREGSHPALMSY